MPSTCWASTSSAPGADRRGVLRAEIVGVERRPAFDHLEAVGRDEDRLRRLVEAVVGAADPLRQPARALRRADIDDEVDVAPVDAEVERRGADDGAELSCRHRRLDLAPLGGVERAVMEGDRVALAVDPPQLLEDQLGLAADIDEEERHAVCADRGVDVGDGVARRCGPTRARARPNSRIEMSGLAPPATTTRSAMAPVLPHQPRPQRVRLGDGRREADRSEPRRQPAEPRQAEGEEVAALAGDQRVQLVEDDRVEIGEEARRVVGGEEERRLLGRGEEDVRRVQLLALALVDGRVAGARLEADGEAHLGDRPFEVARDIDGERFQRRDVERVRPAPAGPLGRRPLVQRDEVGRNPASVLPAPVGAMSSVSRPAARLRQQLELMRPRRPAAIRKPGRERRREKGRRIGQDGGRGHRARGNPGGGGASIARAGQCRGIPPPRSGGGGRVSDAASAMLRWRRAPSTAFGGPPPRFAGEESARHRLRFYSNSNILTG